ALGPRLRAAVASNFAEAASLLDGAGRDGGAALVPAGDASAPGAFASAGSPSPAPEAESLLDHVDTEGDGAADSLPRGLLADVWVVESFERLRPDLRGVAVTRDGRGGPPRA